MRCSSGNKANMFALKVVSLKYERYGKVSLLVQGKTNNNVLVGKDFCTAGYILLWLC